MFKKVIKLDQNVNVQKQAIKAFSNICLGLRKPFEKGARIIFPLLLEKLKDKKAMEDALTALLNIVHCVDPKSLSEPIKECLLDKNPQMKINIMVWITQLIESNKEMVEQF
jgi:hypothetical protein